ncbi:MAG TPA: SDR family oxidoreductase [Bacillota bacterium]|nr:SDR family oxidoreductase [Bacillota bacterium]
MDFATEVFIVSGSGSGIGRSCAEMLLQSGAVVIGLDCKQSAINHENYHHFQTNLRDEEEIKAAVEEAEKRFERLDGLVNCAGVYATVKPFYEISIDEWDRVIGTNLTGTFLLSKYVTLKMMKRKAGRIVNISCIRSRIFRPDMADYAASKAGVVALTSAMALDLQNYHIRVNSVAPGFTYTGMTAASFDNPEVRSLSERIIPAGRIAQPDDIARVVLFLLSDMSNYINGETIFVDGGFKISK